MTKRVAILQSNYIPWKGYFDLINSVDEFVIYDDAQFTKNDWRNRNIIKTRQGLKWLTIPVRHERLGQSISETRIADARWPKRHWSTLSQNYSRAKYFDDYRQTFEDLYETASQEFLSEINYQFIVAINEALGIRTRIRRSCEFELADGQTERLLGICRQCGATDYLSGPAAREYLDLGMAERANIKVSWMEYGGYPEYPQLFGEFEHGVSILDLLFNTGTDAKRYMKTF